MGEDFGRASAGGEQTESNVAGLLRLCSEAPAAASNEHLWINPEELILERELLVALLPEDKRKQVFRCQVEVSQADTPAGVAKALKGLNSIDPRLTSLNCRIQGMLQGFEPAPKFEFKGLAASGISSTQCHSKSQTSDILSRLDLGCSSLFTNQLESIEARTARSLAANRSGRLTASLRSTTAEIRQARFLAPFQEFDDLSKSYGVGLDLAISANGVKPEFYVIEGAKRKALPINFEFAIEPQIRLAIEAKCHQIEREFPIDIASAESEFANNAEPGLIPKFRFRDARIPRLDYLNSLESALIDSRATLDRGVKQGKLRILFAEGTGTSITASVRGLHYPKLLDGKPLIGLFAETFEEAQDGPEPIQDNMRDMRRTAMHELAHQHQLMIGWRENGSMERFAEDMGWHQNGKEWLLRGKSQSEFFKLDKPSGDWLLCSKDGILTTVELSDGSKEPLRYSSEVMREKALVRPGSYYFDNPTEMYAEAMANYRLGKTPRMELGRFCPVLYSMVQRQDDMELADYAQRSNLAEGLIRRPSGETVPKTPEAIKEVFGFEWFCAEGVPLIFKEPKWVEQMQGLFGDPTIGPEKRAADFAALSVEINEAMNSPQVQDHMVTVQQHLPEWISDGLTSGDPSVDPFRYLKVARALSNANHAAQLFSQGKTQEADDALKLATEGASGVSVISFDSLKLTDAEIAKFGVFPDLSYVSLRGYELSAETFKALGAYNQLRSLQLTNAKLNLADLLAVPQTRGVERLALRNVQGISDLSIPEIISMPNLNQLELSGTGITDEGLATLIAAKPNLNLLGVIGSQVTEAGVLLLANGKYEHLNVPAISFETVRKLVASGTLKNLKIDALEPQEKSIQEELLALREKKIFVLYNDSKPPS